MARGPAQVRARTRSEEIKGHVAERRSSPPSGVYGRDTPGWARQVQDLQRRAGNAAVVQLLAGSDPSGPGPERAGVQEVIRAGGSPLDAVTRRRMEGSFGSDFSDVRIHTGPRAAESAAALGASAYTVGNDVVLAGGYDSGDARVQRTLAHELTHVVQQRSGPVDGTPAPGGIRVSDPSDCFERAAERSADRVMAGLAAHPSVSERPGPPSGGAAVQRVITKEKAEETGEFVETLTDPFESGLDPMGGIGDGLGGLTDIGVAPTGMSDPTSGNYNSLAAFVPDSVSSLADVATGVGSTVASGVGLVLGGMGTYKSYKGYKKAKNKQDVLNAKQAKKAARNKALDTTATGVGTAGNVIGTAGHGTQAGLSVAGAVLPGAGATLSMGAAMAGGATAVAVGPLAAAVSIYNAQKQITTAVQAGNKRRNVFNLEATKKAWKKKETELPAEIKKLKDSKTKLEGRRTAAAAKLASGVRRKKHWTKVEKNLADKITWIDARINYKEEEQRLVALDNTRLTEIESAMALDVEEVKKAKKEGRRSMTDVRPPKSVSEVKGFYWEKKRRAEWHAAVEGAGSTLQAAGSLASTIGGVLAIAGAAAMGLGAIPGLVVTAVGGLTSLVGSAVSAVSQGSRLVHYVVKRVAGTRNTVRTSMARFIVRVAAGLKGDPAVNEPLDTTKGSESYMAGVAPGATVANGSTNPVHSANKEQKSAWAFIANSQLIPGYTTYAKVQESVESQRDTQNTANVVGKVATTFSDPTAVEELVNAVADSFRSDRA